MNLNDKLACARADIHALKGEIAGLQKYITKLRPCCDNCKGEDNKEYCDGCNSKAFGWVHKEIFTVKENNV